MLRQEPPVFLKLPEFLISLTNSVAPQSPSAECAGISIITIYEQGILPFTLCEAVSIIADLQILLKEASTSHVTKTAAAELVRHIWYGSCTLHNAQSRCLTPLEKTCRYVLMIHFYLQLFAAPPVLIGWMMGPLIRQLRLLLLDLDHLLVQCPEFVLWLVLTAGSFARGEMRTRMSQVLITLQQRHNYGSYTDATGGCCRTIQWVQYIEEAALDFWTESDILACNAVEDLPFLTATRSSNIDDNQSDLMEACELEFTVLGLIPIGL